MQTFVANNPVEDAAYEAVREEVASFVEDWFAGHELAYGRDHDLVVGGDVDLASANPELHHDIADMAEAVRRLYLRSA
jgi:hypothetical protein